MTPVLGVTHSPLLYLTSEITCTHTQMVYMHIKQKLISQYIVMCETNCLWYDLTVEVKSLIKAFKVFIRTALGNIPGAALEI